MAVTRRVKQTNCAPFSTIATFAECMQAPTLMTLLHVSPRDELTPCKARWNTLHVSGISRITHAKAEDWGYNKLEPC